LLQDNDVETLPRQSLRWQAFPAFSQGCDYFSTDYRLAGADDDASSARNTGHNLAFFDNSSFHEFVLTS